MAGDGLDRLFRPAAIAVVGASASPGKAGHQLLRALEGFPGRLHPVNPAGGEICGLTAFADVRSIPEPVDLAVLAVPPAAVPGALADCAGAGVAAAVICAGGFAEVGPEGAALQAEVAAIAREARMRLLGPNTSGFVNPASRVTASFVPAAGELSPGRLAVVAQSGGVHHALAFAAHGEGLGLRLGVGLGNAADVGFADVLDHLAGDDGVGAVALAIEGVADGRGLAAAVRRLSPRVPVAALVVGRADVAELARSHTGAVAGSWAVTRAALRHAGAVVVDTTTELLDAAKALMAARLPPRSAPGVGVVTGQAGPGLVVADALRSRGVRLPELAPATRRRLAALLPPLTFQRNPVDTGRPGADFSQVVRAVADDPSVDVTLVYALHEPAALDPVAALGAVAAGGEEPSAPEPLVFGTGGPPEAVRQTAAQLGSAGVPTYTAPERAADAVGVLVRDAEARAVAAPEGQPTLAAVPAPPGWASAPRPLDEHETKVWLEAAGLRCPRRRACRSRDDARAALGELAPPVVVKLLDAAVTHKSDIGGVHLGIRSPDDLERALDAIDAIGAGSAETGYLVEETVGDGVELLAGARRDPSFGPIVVLGLGGLGVEALADVAVRLAPVGPAEVDAMAGELAGRELLDGARGRSPVDRSELTRVLGVLGNLLASRDEIAEIEVNPLIATSGGLVVADAVVVLSETGSARDVSHRVDVSDIR